MYYWQGNKEEFSEERLIATAKTVVGNRQVLNTNVLPQDYVRTLNPPASILLISDARRHKLVAVTLWWLEDACFWGVSGLKAMPCGNPTGTSGDTARQCITAACGQERGQRVHCPLSLCQRSGIMNLCDDWSCGSMWWLTDPRLRLFVRKQQQTSFTCCLIIMGQEDDQPDGLPVKTYLINCAYASKRDRQERKEKRRNTLQHWQNTLKIGPQGNNWRE